VLENLPALVSKIELEPSLHDLDEPRELHRARTGPGFASTTPEHSAVKRRAAPESEAGLEAVFGPDRTIRLCHVRRVAIVALSGRPGTQCIRRDPRTPRVGTPMQAVIAGPRRAPRSILSRAPSSCFKLPHAQANYDAGGGWECREPIRTSEPSRLALSR
jgi:hypothetical protein